DPDDPIWPNRDRFVLSMGHASMLLYSMLHLAGVKAVNPEYERLGEFALGERYFPRRGTQRLAAVSDSANPQRKGRETKMDRNRFASASVSRRFILTTATTRLEFLDRMRSYSSVIREAVFCSDFTSASPSFKPFLT